MTPGTQWTPYEISIVRQRHFAGDSDPQIARELGRKPDGVRYIREKMSIYREPSKYRPLTTPFEDGYQACLYHLIDLIREFGGEGATIGDAKAVYRSRCEYDVPEGYRPRYVHPHVEERSYVGSHFADVPR